MKITDLMFKPGKKYQFVTKDNQQVAIVEDAIYEPWYVRYMFDPNDEKPTTQSIYKVENDVLLVCSEVTLAPGLLHAGMERLSEEDFFYGEILGVPFCRLTLDRFDDSLSEGIFTWKWKDNKWNTEQGTFYYNVYSFIPSLDKLIIHEIDQESKPTGEINYFDRVEVYDILHGYEGYRDKRWNNGTPVFRKELCCNV